MVQTILVLSRVLETETQRLFGGQAEDDAGSSAPEAPSAAKTATEKNTRASSRNAAKQNTAATTTTTTPKKNAVPDTCLALFRVCMAWIAAQHEDIITFKEHLAPHLADMHRSVTRCLSLFIELIAATEASPTPYLLPEDVEVIGLAPLDTWTALRESDAPDSAFKPCFDEEGVDRRGDAYETLARIYDIVECTVRLIGNPGFPWVLETAHEGGREVTRISYAEDYAQAPSAGAVAAAGTPTAITIPAAALQPTPQPAANVQQPRRRGGQQRQLKKQQQQQQQQVEVIQASQTPRPSQTAQAAPPPQIATPTVAAQASGRPLPAVLSTSYKDMDDDDFLPGSMKEPTRLSAESAAFSPAASAAYVPSAATITAPDASDAELDLLESAAYSRVENFLSPPELHPHAALGGPMQAATPSSSSYGMHTTTADDVFGQLQTPHVSGISAAAKPIPSAPWADNGYAHSLGYYPVSQAGPTLLSLNTQNQQPSAGQAMRPPANVEEQLAFLTVAKQQELQYTAAAAATAASATVPPTSYYGIDSSSRGFPSALSPVGGASTRTMSPPSARLGGGPGGFVNPWATTTTTTTTNGNANGSRLLPQQLQQAQAASLGIGSLADAGQHSPSSLLYAGSFGLSSALSSLPSVHSPRGLPGRQPVSVSSASSAYDAFYGGMSPHRSPSNGHYSAATAPASRPFGSMGAPSPSSTTGQWNDAATAWGRGTPVGKDDPTHFRNAVRPTGLMEDTTAYDRQALLSALYDDEGPRGGA